MKEETTVLDILMPIIAVFAWIVFSIIAGAFAQNEEEREEEQK